MNIKTRQDSDWKYIDSPMEDVVCLTKPNVHLDLPHSASLPRCWRVVVLPPSNNSKHPSSLPFLLTFFSFHRLVDPVLVSSTGLFDELLLPPALPSPTDSQQTLFPCRQLITTLQASIRVFSHQ